MGAAGLTTASLAGDTQLNSRTAAELWLLRLGRRFISGGTDSSGFGYICSALIILGWQSMPVPEWACPLLKPAVAADLDSSHLPAPSTLYLDHNAGRHMFEHYTVAGFVGGLAPWTMAFHKLFFKLTLIQGKQSRIVLSACHLHHSGSHSWEEQCWLLLKPKSPVPRAHPDQRCRETEQSPGAHCGHKAVQQDLRWRKNEAIFSLCSPEDSQASNTDFHSASVAALHVQGM